MTEYIVRWNYGSSLGGPWIEGQSVELTSTEALAINQDSPNVLVAVEDMNEPLEEQEYRCPHCGEVFRGGSAYAQHKPVCAEEHAGDQVMSSENFGALIIK